MHTSYVQWALSRARSVQGFVYVWPVPSIDWALDKCSLKFVVNSCGDLAFPWLWPLWHALIRCLWSCAALLPNLRPINWLQRHLQMATVPLAWPPVLVHFMVGLRSLPRSGNLFAECFLVSHWPHWPSLKGYWPHTGNKVKSALTFSLFSWCWQSHALGTINGHCSIVLQMRLFRLAIGLTN